MSASETLRAFMGLEEKNMTDRELWLRMMDYEEVDRPPVMHWTGWPETLERWRSEGMPADADEHAFLGVTRYTAWIDCQHKLFPPFDQETIEETSEYILQRQDDGVVAKHWKNRSCIPHYEDFLLKGRADWPEYKKRLQPHPARIPDDLDEQARAAWASSAPVGMLVGSLVGWIRDWMGVENLAYLCYDDRDLLCEMVDTIADLQCWCIEQVLGRHEVDWALDWEDICFRSGPLVSPDIFRECALRGYQKISSKLREFGVRFYGVDCDGMVDHLIPVWLEGGVNIMFPLEIGAWKADPARTRRRFGKGLRILGGVDKLEIAKGPAAIDAEIARRVPLMKEGGFVPLPDHLIIPETSLEDYRYYLKALSEVRL